MPSRFLMRAARLATLALLFCHVGQETISIFILFSNLPWMGLVSAAGRVPPEEGVRLPRRPRVRIGDFEEEPARDLFVEGGGAEIDGLAQVVRRGVIAPGEPILEDLLLGRAELEAHVQLERGNAVADEAVLVAADEAVAQRLRIGDGLD